MSVLVDAVRTASRAQRYARLRRAESGTARGGIGAALLLWGVPALAPALALLATATGRSRGLVEIGAALLLTAFQAHLIGKPRLQAFDLLYQPSRAGIALGHLLRRAPWLAWAGATSGGAWLIVMPWLPHRAAGAPALAAVMLAPVAIAASSGATRLAGRAGRDESATVLPFLFPLLGWEAARIWLEDGPWRWVLPVAGGVVGVAIAAGTGGLLATLRRAALLVVVTLLVAAPSAPRGPGFTDDSLSWLVAAFTMAAACLFVIALSVRTQLRCAELAEVIDTRGDAADGAGARSRGRAPSPLRRERAATGLWRAQLAYARDEWLPDEESGEGALRAWAGTGMVLLVTAFRGPLVAAAAVALAGADRTPVWLALLAGCLAGRIAAVDQLELQPRLWLLGVDYREQVLQGLRSMLVFAAVPTLLVATAALAIAGPQDAGRQAAVLVIAATLLARAGLPGLWPLQEVHRLRLAVVWGALLVLCIAYEAWWTPLEALYAAGAGAAAGVVLLAVRLLRLREPHVADCVRRAGEP